MEAVDFGKFEWAARRSKRRPVQLKTRNYIITTSFKIIGVEWSQSDGHVLCGCAGVQSGNIIGRMAKYPRTLMAIAPIPHASATKWL
jgi:hypothetical protein